MNFPVMIIEKLFESPIIKKHIERRMRAYAEPSDKSGAFIIVLPIAPASATAAASNNYLAESQHMQVDVQGANHEVVYEVAREVRKVMYEAFNMTAQNDGLDTYFDETKRYLVSRNYAGIPQNINYKESII